MHILILADKGRSLDAYTERLKAWGITSQVVPAPEIKWKGSDLDKKWLASYCDILSANRAESIDMVQFFLKDWHTERGTVGRHYGHTFSNSSYQVAIVRMKRGMERTGQHEIMHALDNIVWTYLGIRLAKIVKVEDWDEDVVHARDERFRGDYDPAFEIVELYVKAAIQKRKQLAALRLMERLKVLQRNIMANKETEDISPSRADRLYDEALSSIGTDASPSDIAPDELGCAETVSNLIKRVLPNFPILTGTWSLFDALERHPDFRKVAGTPEPGDIILSPTGTGVGIFPGHVGIYGEDGKIMSNSSLKSTLGKFLQNYTTASWQDRYVKWGGFKVHIYRLTK